MLQPRCLPLASSTTVSRAFINAPSPSTSSSIRSVHGVTDYANIERPLVDWRVRFPKKYFDHKGFRQALEKKKYRLARAEYQEVRKAYAKPAPEGWTVLTFLEKMNFGEGAEEIASVFESWEEFVSMGHRDLRKVQKLNVRQRRRVMHYLRLFNNDLWPLERGRKELMEKFAGTKLSMQGKPWEMEEDGELLRLCDYYDVNFGDPWLYIGYDMGRHPDEVRDRYIEIVLKPKYAGNKCELALTRCTRPLLLNRKFKLMPPLLFVVPTFPVPNTEFKVTGGFAKYQDD